MRLIGGLITHSLVLVALRYEPDQTLPFASLSLSPRLAEWAGLEWRALASTNQKPCNPFYQPISKSGRKRKKGGGEQKKLDGTASLAGHGLITSPKEESFEL